MATENTPKPQNEVRLPDSIKIGETTFVLKDTPELLDLVGTIAKLEKSKLYTNIEKLKEGIKNLEKVDLTGPNFNSMKEELREEMTDAIKTIMKPLLENTQKTQQESIQQYKEKVLLQNEGKCFPEMVKGTTKEEIDNSLRESINLRAKYPTSSVPIPATPAPAAQVPGTPPAKIDTVPDSSQVSQPIYQPVPRIHVDSNHASPDIGKMSHEDFAAQRDALRRGLDQFVS